VCAIQSTTAVSAVGRDHHVAPDDRLDLAEEIGQGHRPGRVRPGCRGSRRPSRWHATCLVEDDEHPIVDCDTLGLQGRDDLRPTALGRQTACIPERHGVVHAHGEHCADLVGLQRRPGHLDDDVDAVLLAGDDTPAAVNLIHLNLCHVTPPSS